MARSSPYIECASVPLSLKMYIQLEANDSIPEIAGKSVEAGRVELPPTRATFLTFAGADNTQ